MIVDELIAILGYDIRGEENLRRFNSGLERTAALANRVATALVAAGTIAAGAMLGLGKSVIETSAKFEGFQTSLETIEGSAEKAKASMDWITKFAAKTPYELAGVTEAFIKLKSYGIDPMDGTLTTLGDTASAMNKPLNQAVEAFADATNFQFERLREFGVTASQKGEEVTFKWTKNGKTLTKVVKKNGGDIQKFLKEHWGATFNGAMLRQSKTWNGMMSNLGDSWDLFKKRIGDAGFFQNVKNRLAGVLDAIGKLDESGKLDQWAKRISDALSAGFKVLADITEQVIKDAYTIGTLIDSLGGKIGDFLRYVSGGKINLDNWQAIVAMLAGLLVVLKPAWAMMALLALAADDFLTYLRGGKSVIGDFIDAIAKFLGAKPEQVADALGKIALAAAGLLIVGKVAGGIRALALALGLMGGAQAAAGITALTTVGGLSMAAGLVALAASAAAAAGSIKLLWDAVKEDPKLAKAAGGSLFDFVWGRIFGNDTNPEQSFVKTNPVKPVGKGTPIGASDRAKENAWRNKPDQVDWALEEARKETERARLAYGPQLVSNVKGNMSKMGGAAQTVVNDTKLQAPITTVVNLKVEEITQAASAAANAVKTKVTSALSGISNSHPTRTTPSPTF